MKKLLYPFSFIYWAVICIRNQLFDRALLKIRKFNTPVISIGNITMGGTGKTPIIAALLEWAESQGLRAAVVSRGYGGGYSGIQKVSPNGSPSEFGDEPLMLAKRFLTTPIYVAKRRVLGVEAIIRNEQIDIVFADDAFQHRHLGRQLDIVIIDATEPISAYKMIPVGRAREPLANITRANHIILNKVNLISPDEKSQLIDLVEEKLSVKPISIIESEYHIDRIRNGRTNDGALANGERVILVSGIGRPSSFEKLVSSRCKVMEHLIFQDHVDYMDQHIRQLQKAMSRHSTGKVITTEKDFVKLVRFEPIVDSLWVAELRPKLGLQARIMFEDILRLHKEVMPNSIEV